MANQEIQLKIKTLVDAASTETSLRRLRGLMRDLQSAGEEVADTNEEAFNSVQQAINRVESRIGDATDRLRVMSGEPLERVRSGFGLIGEGVKNLDFGKMTIGINGLADGIKDMNLSDFKKGVGDVTSSFLNLGKALLTNPIFLLVTVIITLIKNFDNLRESGGLVGQIFSAIGAIIENVIDFFKTLSDTIGLTNLGIEGTVDRIKAATEGVDDLISSFQKLRESADQSTIIEQLNQLKLAYEDNRISLEVLVNKYNFSQEEVDGLISKFRELRQAQMEQIGGSNEAMAAFLKNMQKTYGKEHAEKLFDALKKEYDAFFKWESGAVILRNQAILEADKNNIAAQKSFINTIRNERQKELEAERIDYQGATYFRKKELDKQLEDLIESTNAALKTTLLTQEDKIKIVEDAEADLSKILVKRNQDNVNLSKLSGSLIVGLEERKYKEIENREVQHNQTIEKINLKYKLEKLQNQQNVAKLEYDLQLKELDYYTQKAYFTTEESEKMKQTLLTKFNKEEEKRINDIYDTQIKQAVGNADKIKFIESQKVLAIKNLKLEEERYIKESNEAIQKEKEEQLKENERIIKESYEIQKEIQASIVTSYEEFYNNIRLQDKINTKPLDQLTDTFKNRWTGILTGQITDLKNYYKERLKLENDATIANLLSLHQKETKELLDNETNTINKEHRKKEIEDKYRLLRLEAEKEHSDNVIQIEERRTDDLKKIWDRRWQNIKNINEIVNNVEEMFRKNSEKESESTARRKFIMNKVLGAGVVITDTIIGVQKAMSLNPTTLGAPQSIAIALAGAANLAKILAQKFEYNSGSSAAASAGGSGTAPAAPTMATPQSPFFGQAFAGALSSGNVSNIASWKTSSQMVYVLESDITNAQRRVSVQRGRSLLGP